MKNLIILILTVLINYIGTAQTQRVSPPIEAITVYLNNAEIQRNITTQIPKGKSTLVFENISNKILDKGLKITSNNDVKIRSVAIEKNSKDYLNQTEFKELERRLEQINTDINAHKMSIKTLQKEILFLESNMKLGNSNMSFSKIDQGQQYFSRKISEVQKNILSEEEKISQLKTSYSKLIDSQTELENKAVEKSAQITITLNSNSSTTCTINLRYLVSNAVWKPVYSMRTNEDSKTISIEYQAKIFNDTGNDWNNKPITLAILDSSDEVDKPELNTWNLNQNYGSGSSRKNWNQYNNNSQNDPEHDTVEFDVLEIDDLSTRFELTTLYQIPSDATPHLIDVITYQKPVDFYTLSIPKIKNGAFLIAKIKNWESLGLIDGTVNLYYNNTFQGSSTLETQQIENTLNISMGRENSFTISRQKVSEKSKKNLFGTTIREILTYEIMVKNNKNETKKIQIADQIPISNDKDIEVTPLKTSNGKIDLITGKVQWDLKLNAKEVRKLTIQFEIKYPKNQRNKINYSTNTLFSPRYF